ncbi:MAG: hypothetical protein HOD54_00780, partial [Candidatus Magasanikbacteria bacterium]|nr:hypothetical protein [Candidatus Magasanikbacteria bacterium]
EGGDKPEGEEGGDKPEGEEGGDKPEGEEGGDKPRGPASMWGDKGWEQAANSLDDKTPEEEKKEPKERSSITQGINKLRNRPKIKKIDKQIKKIDKSKKPLNRKKKKLKRKLIPLEISKKALTVSINFLRIVKAFFYALAIFSAILIIPIFLGATEVIWGIGMYMKIPIKTMKATRRKLKKEIKKLKKKIEDIENEIKDLNKDIQDLSKQRRQLLNQSLLEKNNNQE